MHELKEAVEAVKELKRHMLRRDRSAWCVLYCGGVKKVQDDLQASCEQWKFHYSEESFAWCARGGWTQSRSLRTVQASREHDGLTRTRSLESRADGCVYM